MSSSSTCTRVSQLPAPGPTSGRATQPGCTQASGHIGQLFWDQALIDEIETRGPYCENMAPATPNSGERVFSEQETADTDSDPLHSYALFGEDVTSGVLAWIVTGVNPSLSGNPAHSFALTKGRVVAVDNIGGGDMPLGNGPLPPCPARHVPHLPTWRSDRQALESMGVVQVVGCLCSLVAYILSSFSTTVIIWLYLSILDEAYGRAYVSNDTVDCHHLSYLAQCDNVSK